MMLGGFVSSFVFKQFLFRRSLFADPVDQWMGVNLHMYGYSGAYEEGLRNAKRLVFSSRCFEDVHQSYCRRSSSLLGGSRHLVTWKRFFWGDSTLHHTSPFGGLLFP